MAVPSDSLLGKQQGVPECYAPDILFPIARSETRSADIVTALERAEGFDVWNAWEISWLNSDGKPQQATGKFTVPANSPNIIESKSLKLYLNSLNNHRISSWAEAERLISDDLSRCAVSDIEVQLNQLEGQQVLTQASNPAGDCLDDIEVTEPEFSVNHTLIALEEPKNQIEQQLYTRLFRSSCPVTGQPDWATVVIKYKGDKIQHQGLLRYLLSYRNNQEFHEQCVERIFADVSRRCRPDHLLVQACFLRRGGLDISPVRYTGYKRGDALQGRTLRQ